jgi:hypothetical protein
MMWVGPEDAPYIDDEYGHYTIVCEDGRQIVRGGIVGAAKQAEALVEAGIGVREIQCRDALREMSPASPIPDEYMVLCRRHNGEWKASHAMRPIWSSQSGWVMRREDLPWGGEE